MEQLVEFPVKTLIVIAGPTAIGKTALAIRIAQRFQTEIISADSRQFYRETTIGTAKPSETELAGVKHHFINSHSITETFTVGDYEAQAMSVLNELFLRKNAAVLAGGSGLYINAVCKGFDDLPKSDPGIREKLNRTYQENGLQALQQELKDIDPDYYRNADIQNPQRVIRALEVYYSTGTRFSSYRTGSVKERPFRIIKVGLNTEREQLYRQINKRVDQMIQDGLIAEVASLTEYRHLNALKTVGYTELFEYLDGAVSLDEAVARIKQNTRNFAKRQLTWFRKDPDITWFEPDEYDNIIRYLAKVP